MTSERVSDERLAEMLAGLEGVTPGPWFVREYSGGWSSPYRMVWNTDGRQMCIESVPAVTAAHIARCDPDTMRSILTELQSLRRSGGVAVKGQIRDAVEQYLNQMRAAHADGHGEVGSYFSTLGNLPDFVAARLSPAPGEPVEVTAAARDVLAERRRQIEVEGWTPEHDDQHQRGELARAGAAYAIHWTMEGYRTFFGGQLWPWNKEWWKPGRPEAGQVKSMRRRNLVKAGALILAEIERLDRAALKREGE